MDWNSIYRSRVTTAEEATREIRSGDRVWVHPGCNTPARLIDAMVARAPELEECSSIDLPLAKILEGGTWSAGRKIARERRSDGGPPITLLSDGTLF